MRSEMNAPFISAFLARVGLGKRSQRISNAQPRGAHGEGRQTVSGQRSQRDFIRRISYAAR